MVLLFLVGAYEFVAADITLLQWPEVSTITWVNTVSYKK